MDRCSSRPAGSFGSSATITTSASQIGKSGAADCSLWDVWAGTTHTTTGTISARVPAHGVVMYGVS